MIVPIALIRFPGARALPNRIANCRPGFPIVYWRFTTKRAPGLVIPTIYRADPRRCRIKVNGLAPIDPARSYSEQQLNAFASAAAAATTAAAAVATAECGWGQGRPLELMAVDQRPVKDRKASTSGATASRGAGDESRRHPWVPLDDMR